MLTSLKNGLLASVAAGTLLASAATAQEITFRFAHVFSATHWLWTESGTRFVNEVQQASNGRIAFEVYPAGQLGRETVSYLSSGLADMGIAVPSYEADALPLTSVLELPGIIRDSCSGVRQFESLAAEGGVLYENEYRDLGFHVLYVNVLPPYALITSTRPVSRFEDIAGLKIRANGNAMTMTARALGAAPVPVTSSELFDSLTRGTVDGVLLAVGSVPSLDLANVLNYSVDPIRLGGGVTFTVINLDVWNGLSAEDQQILTTAAQNAQEYLCQFLDNREIEVQEQLVAAGQFTVTTLPDDELTRWTEALSGIATDWANGMDASGRPGSAVLQALYDAPTE